MSGRGSRARRAPAVFSPVADAPRTTRAASKLQRRPKRTPVSEARRRVLLFARVSHAAAVACRAVFIR